MIKLLAMSVFIVVGAVIGGLFYRKFGNDKLTLPMCLIIGILGAFAGLWIPDITDIRLVGNLVDSLLFSSIGSALLLGLNLVISRKK